MVRIQIIDWSTRKRYRKYLERYFKIRHQIYVEQRRWHDIARPIPIEMDSYDTKDAIYLLALDRNQKIVGGSRLVPTLRPHLLSEVFPMLAKDGPPRGDRIYEWTRFFIDRHVRMPGKSSPYAGIMLAGLQEVALHLGVKQISVVCEAFWPARLRALDWNVQQLGDVLPHPDGDIVALLIDVSKDALDGVRRAYHIPNSLLTQSV